MKKLWRRASGRIKDRNTLWMTSLTKKSRHRHPDLEVAVIRATSHDDTLMDYENAQRVFNWVRTSPTHLTIVLWALTHRAQRTRDWVVSLKALILLHGVLCSKAPGTRRIGRLPFDLSGFNDAYTKAGHRHWARNSFVRAYFAFVDLKSVVMAAELREEMVGNLKEKEEVEKGENCEVRMELVRVRRRQDLLDAILQVQPQAKGMMEDVVVLEAMECVIIELFEVYSKICEGIAMGLMKICTDKLGKEEAGMALDVLQRATRQGQELSDYFEYCRRFGLLHASECPKIEKIPEEDFVELERIINGSTVSTAPDQLSEKIDSEDTNCEGALVVVDDKWEIQVQESKMPWLKTVITDKWEVFDEDVDKVDKGNENLGVMFIDPFAASYSFPVMPQYNPFIDHGGTPSQLVISLT